jgi:UrcA family protein
MFRSVLTLSAALLAVTPSFAPAAPPQPGTAAGTVVLAGLDLSTPTGVAEAHRRVTLMSERLCREFRDDRKVDDWQNYVNCVRDSVAKTLERIQTTTSSVARN